MNWIAKTLPEPVLVAGVVLRPFTFGHWMFLARVCDWEEGTFPAEDIPVGIWACSRPWREAWTGFQSRSALRWTKKFARSVAGTKAVLDVLSGFQGYLSKALEIPHVSPVRREVAPSNTTIRTKSQIPLLVQLRLFGLSVLHLKDEELCDMPAGDLLGLWLAHLDASGVVHVSDDPRLDGEEGMTWRAWCDAEDAKRLAANPRN